MCSACCAPHAVVRPTAPQMHPSAAPITCGLESPPRRPSMRMGWKANTPDRPTTHMRMHASILMRSPDSYLVLLANSGWPHPPQQKVPARFSCAGRGTRHTAGFVRVCASVLLRLDRRPQEHQGSSNACRLGRSSMLNVTLPPSCRKERGCLQC